MTSWIMRNYIEKGFYDLNPCLVGYNYVINSPELDYFKGR